MLILAPAIAPNRKATIALSAAAETGVPENGGQGSPAEEPAVGEPCETCGQVGGHHPDCPEA